MTRTQFALILTLVAAHLAGAFSGCDRRPEDSDRASESVELVDPAPPVGRRPSAGSTAMDLKACPAVPSCPVTPSPAAAAAPTEPPTRPAAPATVMVPADPREPATPATGERRAPRAPRTAAAPRAITDTRPGDPAAPLPEKGVEIVASTIATGIVRRVPQNPGQSFDPATGTLYAFVKVKNPHPRSGVEMVWKREGVVRSRIRLKVGRSGAWRTWSKQRIAKKDAGQWTVEVRTPTGRLLETIPFEVAPEGLANRDVE